MADPSRDRRGPGFRAETLAAEHLQRAGLALIERNASYDCGELDLVMRDGATVVVVEVRFRHDGAPVDPETSITREKIRKLILATEVWLLRNVDGEEPPVRFDVVAVEGDLDDPVIRWHRDAFDGDDA